MPTSAILYHLSQTHLSLGDFQILSSWWGLFMVDSCAFGVGLNYLGLSVLMYGGEMFLVMVAWGICQLFWFCWESVSPLGLILQETPVRVGTSTVYTCTRVCVGTQGSCLPVMLMFHFDCRKEHTHVLLLCGFGDAALACHALKDSELPLLKRMVFKEPIFPILLLLWTNPVSRRIKGLKWTEDELELLKL